MKYLTFLLIVLSSSSFAQVNMQLRTDKTIKIPTSIKAESHDLKFSQKYYNQSNQFIELEAGMGSFYPNEQITQTVSSGFTFNKGLKGHYFSIGIQANYSKKESTKAENNVTNSIISPTTTIGYQFSKDKLSLKISIHPTANFAYFGQHLLAATTIGFNCQF